MHSNNQSITLSMFCSGRSSASLFFGQICNQDFFQKRTHYFIKSTYVACPKGLEKFLILQKKQQIRYIKSKLHTVNKIQTTDS